MDVWKAAVKHRLDQETGDRYLSGIKMPVAWPAIIVCTRTYSTQIVL